MLDEEAPPEGGASTKREVVEEFCHLVGLHQHLHQLLREEMQLCTIQEANAHDRCRLLLSSAVLQDTGITAADQLQQLLQQLQEEATSQSREATMQSLEALAALEAPVAVDAVRLTAVPPGGEQRPLLALPLPLLARLAAVSVVNWSTIIVCLSSHPGLMKTHLQEVVTIITAPPDAGASSSPPPDDVLLKPCKVTPNVEVVPASQLCLALMTAAFCTSQSSRTQNFAKKVLQVLTFKIVKYLLKTCSAHLQASQPPASASAAPTAASASAAPTAASAAAVAGIPEAQWRCCALIEFYDLLLNGDSQVGQRCVVDFFSFHLRLAVTSDAMVQLSYVLQNQQLFRTAALHPLLRGVLRRVCVVLGWEPVVQLLDSALRHQEVSWPFVLPLVATLVSLSQPAALRMQELVVEYLHVGCTSEDQELCMLGLVLARQCCEEGPHAFFPRYPHWFTATFGSSASTPASTRKTFSFLVKVLCSLVPYDSALQLRTHTTQGMAVPQGCHDLLRDYQLLARTRLKDISGSTFPSTQALQEVQEAVQQFLQCRQLPAVVLEMSVFRRRHYTSVFLPTLLAHRCQQGWQDFIDALSASAHLPTSLLSQAVAVHGNEASLPATPASALEDLRLLLQHLSTTAGGAAGDEHGCSGNEQSTTATDGDAAGVQNALSDAAAAVEKFLHAEDAVLTHEAALCAHDIHRLHQPRLLQVLRLLLECVGGVVGLDETVVEAADQSLEGRRPAWLPQLVALLAVSPSLQGTFLVQALRLVTDGHSTSSPTSATELRVMGIVMCEVSLLDGLFMSVRSSWSSTHRSSCNSTNRSSCSDSDVSSISLPQHLLQCIAPSTPSASWAAARMLSAWLSWKAVCSAAQRKSSEDDMVESCKAVPGTSTDHHGDDDMQGTDVSAVYRCVLWRLEEMKHLLPPSFDVCGLVTTSTSAMPSLAAWLKFELRCGREVSHASRSRSLQRRINQHFPLSDGRSIMRAALSVLVGTPLLEQEDRLCLLSLLQQVTTRLSTPLPEGLLSSYRKIIGKSSLHHGHIVGLLQDVPPAVVVGGLSGSEVQELLLPLLLEIKTRSPTVHLSSDITSCLLSALLLVRPPSVIADAVLNHLWYSAAFHWASVSWVLEENLRTEGIVMAFPSLQELWTELGPLASDNECVPGSNDTLAVERLSALRPELTIHYLLGAALRRLRLHSDAPPKLHVHLLSGLLRKMYVKTLAAIVGEHVFNHHISYFSKPDEKGSSNLIGTFQERLLKHCTEMLREEMTEDIAYFLESISSTSLDGVVESYYLFGFVHISLCCLNSQDSDKLSERVKCRILHLLISCHCAFSEHSDKYNNLYETISEDPPSKRRKLSVDSTADYPLQLSQQIVRHIQTTGQSCLRLLLPVLPAKVDDAVKKLIEKISLQFSCREHT